MFKKRIKNSIKLLDEKAPANWIQFAHNFEMIDARYCVLGKIFGNFYNGINILGIEENDSQYAFTLKDKEDTPMKWNKLQEEWEEQLALEAIERMKPPEKEIRALERK